MIAIIVFTTTLSFFCFLFFCLLFWKLFIFITCLFFFDLGLLITPLVSSHFSCTLMEPSWSLSYGSWICNYLCNQCPSPLMLWVRISIRARCTALCDKVCQWLATDRLFSPSTLVSSTNVKHHNPNPCTFESVMPSNVDRLCGFNTVIVRFFYIGGIIDHHCLNSLFHNMYQKQYYLFSDKFDWVHEIFLLFKTHGINSASRKSVIIRIYFHTRKVSTCLLAYK